MTKHGHYDFAIYKGASFSRVLTWKNENENPINLTGYTARLHMRTSYDAASPFITLTTENGGIALGGALGTITLSISASDTSAITETDGVYDLELITGGFVTRLLQGSVLVSAEVTR